MRRGQGGRLPVPTMQEHQRAIVEDREIVACSAFREGPLAVMNLALANTATASICIDALSAVLLVSTLKKLFHGCDTPPGDPAIVINTDRGIAIQAGHQSTED